MVASNHYANANGNILLNEGANLMQPPTLPLWGTWGVASHPLWTPTLNIFSPIVTTFRTRLVSMLAD